MKTVILILFVGFLVGCSNNLPLKKTQITHAKSQIVDKGGSSNHISSAFQSTLSSFIPMSSDSLGGDMSWQQMLKDFYMSSSVMYYILFAISFITIGVLIITGVRNKEGSKFNI